jgi:hypothetical protein
MDENEIQLLAAEAAHAAGVARKAQEAAEAALASVGAREREYSEDPCDARWSAVLQAREALERARIVVRDRDSKASVAQHAHAAALRAQAEVEAERRRTADLEAFERKVLASRSTIDGHRLAAACAALMRAEADAARAYLAFADAHAEFTSARRTLQNEGAELGRHIAVSPFVQLHEAEKMIAALMFEGARSPAAEAARVRIARHVDPSRGLYPREASTLAALVKGELAAHGCDATGKAGGAS